MSQKINPRNLTAQLHFRALGNPANSLPSSAISNCFPGLEYDFRNFWRRAFVGLVMLECNNLVLEAEEPRLHHLRGHRLLKVDGRDIVTLVKGPTAPGGSSDLLVSSNFPKGVAFLEWSNSLAYVLQKQGQTVKCHFTRKASDIDEPIPEHESEMLAVELTVRKIFEGESAAPSKDLLGPGELTQGLCSPWQNDYRECACYYWAASRPDYVNIEPGSQGVSQGDNWMSKERTGEYILDDRKDGRLVSYDDLFKAWEAMLRFEIKGRDAEAS
jgi:hypothetical protein